MRYFRVHILADCGMLGLGGSNLIDQMADHQIQHPEAYRISRRKLFKRPGSSQAVCSELVDKFTVGWYLMAPIALFS